MLADHIGLAPCHALCVAVTKDIDSIKFYYNGQLAGTWANTAPVIDWGECQGLLCPSCGGCSSIGQTQEHMHCLGCVHRMHAGQW